MSDKMREALEKLISYSETGFTEFVDEAQSILQAALTQQPESKPAGYMDPWHLKKLREHGDATLFASPKHMIKAIPFYLQHQVSAQAPKLEPFGWIWSDDFFTQSKERADDLTRRGFYLEKVYKVAVSQPQGEPK